MKNSKNGKMNSEIIKKLNEIKDENYAEFSAKLITTVPKDCVLGVRIPKLRILAKGLVRENEYKKFLREKHTFHEEKLLHGFLLGYGVFSIEELIEEIESFLPQVDNWAVCDLTASSLKSVRKNSDIFYEKIKIWLKSGKTYTVRFAIVLLINYYLDEKFDKSIFEELLEIESDEYYVNMALAWYFSFALIKKYDETIRLFEEKIIKSEYVFNKTIQKARESYRISDERKKYLYELKKRR